jgi:cyclophilin family peptidyl-prolyl cis-trans isomerase
MRKILLLLATIAIFSSCNTQKKLGDTGRIVLVETSLGNMKIRLYDETPKHRDNFIKLVSENFFDETLFHRVINEFMIQGGDPDSKDAPAEKMLGEGGPGYQIDAEIVPALFHKKGVLAAAREGDSSNPERKSAGSQFYIAQGKVYTPEELDKLELKINKRRKKALFNISLSENAESLQKLLEKDVDKYALAVDSLNKLAEVKLEKEMLVFTEEQKIAYTTVGGIPHLDGQYTVFGEVIEGLDVLDKIAAVEVNELDRPLEDLKMKISIIE